MPEQSLDERQRLLPEDLLPRVAVPPVQRNPRRKRDSAGDKRHQDALRAILEEASEQMVNVTGPAPYSEIYENALNNGMTGSVYTLKSIHKQGLTQDGEVSQSQPANDQPNGHSEADSSREPSSAESINQLDQLTVTEAENEMVCLFLMNISQLTSLSRCKHFYFI